MSDLGAGDEDASGGEVHAQVAESRGTEHVVQEAPQRDLNENPAQTVVHLVPTDMTTDQEVHDHALEPQLDHGSNEDAGQG